MRSVAVWLRKLFRDARSSPSIRSGEWPHVDDKKSSRLAWGIYASMGAMLVLVIGMSAWGVWHDLHQIHDTLLSSEMNRLRTHALRTVVRIQDQFRDSDGSTLGPHSLQPEKFLRQHWQRSVIADDSRLYAAIVDSTGLIVLHSDSSLEGQRLDTAWYEQTVDEAGDDVVLTRAAALTNNSLAYDVTVPIVVRGEQLGSYHSGLSATWLANELTERRVASQRVWGVLLALIGLTVGVASWSLYRLSHKQAMLTEAVKLTRVRRYAEIGQLMAGIAHEIRNPLNAMRLNLHVLGQQVVSNVSDLPDYDDASLDATTIIAETNREIERVEGLMRILLGYARPDQSHNEDLDLRQEVEATLVFLKTMLERADVVVRARFPDQRVHVHMDRDRLRQILINLINNAKEAVDALGVIDVECLSDGRVAELLVKDNGSGIPPNLRERVFDPFFSTRELGTGLGLAIVRRYVEDAGGTIRCEANSPRGATFRIALPAVRNPAPVTLRDDGRISA